MYKNKTVFISGCNRGVGKNISIRFLESGANLICSMRKFDKKLEKFFNDKKKYKNQQISFLELDFHDQINIKQKIQEKNLQKKQIDFLINNAAMPHGAIFEMTKIDKIKEIFEVNFFSQLMLTQLLIRSLKKSKSPAIINIGSISGLVPDRGNLAYGASKSALMFASKILANELSQNHIRVNSVAPSMINAGMSLDMDEASQKRIQDISYNKNKIPADDISEIVLFLCSENAKFINGSTIRVDGGMQL